MQENTFFRGKSHGFPVYFPWSLWAKRVSCSAKEGRLWWPLRRNCSLRLQELRRKTKGKGRCWLIFKNCYCYLLIIIIYHHHYYYYYYCYCISLKKNIAIYYYYICIIVFLLLNRMYALVSMIQMVLMAILFGFSIGWTNRPWRRFSSWMDFWWVFNRFIWLVSLADSKADPNWFSFHELCAGAFEASARNAFTTGWKGCPKWFF